MFVLSLVSTWSCKKRVDSSIVQRFQFLKASLVPVIKTCGSLCHLWSVADPGFPVGGCGPHRGCVDMPPSRSAMCGGMQTGTQQLYCSFVGTLQGRESNLEIYSQNQYFISKINPDPL